MTNKGSPLEKPRPLEAVSATEAANPPDDPPKYTPRPKSLVDKGIPPLVTHSQLKAHLGLLRAFRGLELEVRNRPKERFPLLAGALGKEQRWVWFLELALERFQRWVTGLKKLRAPDGTVDNPPLDVWLIWHAYMLNPTWYAEDLERVPILADLKTLPVTPLGLLESAGDLPSYQPAGEVSDRWKEATGVPYDPFNAFQELESQEILCPSCNEKRCVPYLTEGRRGYAEKGFSWECVHQKRHGPERFQIDREKLAVAKFFRDLFTDPTRGGDIVEHVNATYLPGTLLTTSGEIDTSRANHIKAKLCEEWARLIFPRGSEETNNQLEECLELSFEELHDRLAPHMEPSLLRRVFSAYNDSRPFSVDLVAAVLRQNSFTEKMHELDWSKPGFFDNKNKIVLDLCIARYQAFLDLMASAPTSFFVPTLDIDIAWHTHQLLPQKYKVDCLRYVKRFINHDDKVEKTHLSNGFDVTCRAWQQRFGVPYAHCGCPLPEETMRQKLHNFSLLVTKRRRSQVNPPNRSDSRSATHPSDHNSVHVCQITNKGLEREQCMAMKRRQRDEQTAIQKARVEEMEKILREARVKERVMERGLDEGAYGRRTEHRRASLLAPTSGHLSYEAMCSGVYNPIWVAAIASSVCSSGGWDGGGGCGGGGGGGGCCGS